MSLKWCICGSTTNSGGSQNPSMWCLWVGVVEVELSSDFAQGGRADRRRLEAGGDQVLWEDFFPADISKESPWLLIFYVVGLLLPHSCRRYLARCPDQVLSNQTGVAKKDPQAILWQSWTRRWKVVLNINCKGGSDSAHCMAWAL